MTYDYKLKQLMNIFLKYISNTLSISDNLRMSYTYNHNIIPFHTLQHLKRIKIISITKSLPLTPYLSPHSCLRFKHPHIILPLNIILPTHYITFPVNGKRYHILARITGEITTPVPFIYKRIIFHDILQ